MSGRAAVGRVASAWELCVGLELHAQIRAQTKAFSPARAAFAARANTDVDVTDAGLPGALPLLNRRCVEAGVATAAALGCTVNHRSSFDRKHYFYADLPMGYQITQQREPLAEGGAVLIGHGDEEMAVTIERLHLEHDSAKSTHSLSDKYSVIDLNRAGTALMEIVTAPDIRSGDMAASFVEQVMLILSTIGTCDGNIAEGSLRVDANVSVRPLGGADFGTRAEIKNIAGLRYLSKAVEYERNRQVALLDSGSIVEPETRNFDPVSGTTIRIRGKEGDTDYRYMPEPDLPPLVLSQGYIDQIRGGLPELPRQTVERLANAHELPPQEFWRILTEPGAVEFFEEAINHLPKRLHSQLYHWLTIDLYGIARRNALSISQIKLEPARLAELVLLIDNNQVSRNAGKQILKQMLEDGYAAKPPAVLAVDMGLVQVSDDSEIEQLCISALESNPKELAKYRDTGNDKYIKFFMGRIMQASKGSADPKRVQIVLRQLLVAERA